MSAAAVAPISGKVEEPTNLRELHERAKLDLATAPSMTIWLRWCFWHARAVGRLEVARALYRRVESEHFNAALREASAFRTPSYGEAPTGGTWRAAEETVIEAAAFAEVTREILAVVGPSK